MKFKLIVTEKELVFFMECMRETFACFDENDYQTRLGISIEEGSSIANKFKELIVNAGIEY